MIAERAASPHRAQRRLAPSVSPRPSRTAGARLGSVAPRSAPARSAPARSAPPRSAATRSAASERRRNIPFLLVAGLLVGALVLSIATLQAVVSQTSFRMADLARRNARLERESGALRLEVARLRSPRRIDRAARHMGLEVRRDVRVLRVPSAARPRGARETSGFALKPVLGRSP